MAIRRASLSGWPRSVAICLSISFYYLPKTMLARASDNGIPQNERDLHVTRMLGHNNINNTLVYTQLVDFRDHEYTVRVANAIEEGKQLIEAGFEYITERDDFKIYRKRK